MKENVSGKMISIVGAGGKTTRLWQLAQEHAQAGERVLVLTSTHMGIPQIGCCQTPEEIHRAFQKQRIVAAGVPCEHHGKLKMGPLPDAVRRQAVAMADFAVVEADGARHMLFKAPYPWEPVIVPETTKILIMVAKEAAGHPIGQVCYNAEEICKLLRTDETHLLTMEDMLFVTEQTYKKRFQQTCPHIPVEIIHRIPIEKSREKM